MKHNGLYRVQRTTLKRVQPVRRTKIYFGNNQNLSSTPPVITFKEKLPASFLDIPGKQAKIGAYGYYKRPISCKKNALATDKN